jgi:hypothetical protein
VVVTAARPGRRPRKARTVTATLAAMMLATELLVVVLVSLALLGLGTLPAPVALGGGGALIVLIAVAAALSSRRIGIVLGWIALIFAAIWTYSMIVGRRIDRRNA